MMTLNSFTMLVSYAELDRGWLQVSRQLRIQRGARGGEPATPQAHFRVRDSGQKPHDQQASDQRRYGSNSNGSPAGTSYLRGGINSTTRRKRPMSHFHSIRRDPVTVSRLRLGG